MKNISENNNESEKENVDEKSSGQKSILFSAIFHHIMFLHYERSTLCSSFENIPLLWQNIDSKE